MLHMLVNYSVQDIFGSLLAFIFFPLIFVLPGYVCAWTLNLFDFRQRLFPARLTISVVISMAVSPVLLFLVYRSGSVNYTLWLLWLLVGGCACLFWVERETLFKTMGDVGKAPRFAAWIFGGWVFTA